MTGVQVWSRVRLAEVADVESGVGFPTVYQGEKEGDFPFYKVSDMNLPGNEVHMRSHNNAISEEVRKKLRGKPFPPGSVIFPKIGAAIATNKKRILTRFSCADNNVMAVIPRKDVLLSEFLFYLFSRKNLSDFASDSNPPSIRKTEVEDWEISVPPLDEQRRIVDILDNAASIQRLREEARAKAREIIPALFVEMFGDPSTNSKGWPVKTVGEVLKVKSGEFLPASAMDPEGTFPVYGGNGVNGHHGEYLFASPVVVIGRVGAYCGNIHLSQPKCWVTDNALYVADMRAPLTLPYLTEALRLARLNRYASQSGQPLISAGRIKDVPLLIPPDALQQEFTERVAEAEGISSLHDRAATAAQQMGQSLLAQVFG